MEEERCGVCIWVCSDKLRKDCEMIFVDKLIKMLCFHSSIVHYFLSCPRLSVTSLSIVLSSKVCIHL